MRRIALGSCLAATLTVAVGGSTASAATLSPSSANFGSQQVNTVSAPRSFVLTAQVTDVLLPLTISTTGDFSQTNTCPSQLGFLLTSSCTINVTFRPTAIGTRSGVLSSTTLLVGGPTASLTGVGTDQAGSGKGDVKANKCKKKGKKKGKKEGKKRAAAAKQKKKGKKKCKKKKKKKGKRKKK